jgi:hypothetical protein
LSHSTSPFLWGFFKIESLELFGRADFEPWLSWSLSPELGLQAWATSTQQQEEPWRGKGLFQKRKSSTWTRAAPRLGRMKANGHHWFDGGQGTSWKERSQRTSGHKRLTGKTSGGKQVVTGG